MECNRDGMTHLNLGAQILEQAGGGRGGDIWGSTLHFPCSILHIVDGLKSFVGKLILKGTNPLGGFINSGGILAQKLPVCSSTGRVGAGG